MDGFNFVVEFFVHGLEVIFCRICFVFSTELIDDRLLGATNGCVLIGLGSWILDWRFIECFAGLFTIVAFWIPQRFFGCIAVSVIYFPWMVINEVQGRRVLASGVEILSFNPVLFLSKTYFIIHSNSIFWFGNIKRVVPSWSGLFFICWVSGFRSHICCESFQLLDKAFIGTDLILRDKYTMLRRIFTAW